MERRLFLKKTGTIAAIGGILPTSVIKSQTKSMGKRKFKMCLNPGAIGVSASQDALLDMAIKYGFEAIVGLPTDLAAMSDKAMSVFLGKMKSNGISFGVAGLPVQFRESESRFREDLAKLPQLAQACQRAGIKGMGTWIMPTNKELTYLENFKQHASRLKETANIIGHYGLSLGLEYVGPKTLMARNKFAFIHTMKETKELITATGESNIGVQLDSFHWFCAGETAADLLTLDRGDIITVDLNDARSGFSADEQIDGKRELPAATGVVDVKAFLEALIQIGYDGPVRAEPFNQPLRDMDDDAALKTTHAAMSKAFGFVGG